MENTEETSMLSMDSTEKYIKIGVLCPLTGNFSAVGKNIVKALEFAVDIINNNYELPLPLAEGYGLANLHNKMIILIFADTAGNPDKGRREARRLIEEEKVTALIGAYNSDVTNLASMEAEALNIPFLTADATAFSLTKRGFKWFFRTQPNGVMYAQLFFELLKYLGNKGMEVCPLGLLSDESFTSIQGTEAALTLASRYGYRISDFEVYSSSVKSLVPQISRIKDSETRVLLVEQQNVEAAVWTIRILKRLDYSPKGFMVQDSVYTSQEFIETVGADGNYIISRLPGHRVSVKENLWPLW